MKYKGVGIPVLLLSLLVSSCSAPEGEDIFTIAFVHTIEVASKGEGIYSLSEEIPFTLAIGHTKDFRNAYEDAMSYLFVETRFIEDENWKPGQDVTFSDPVLIKTFSTYEFSQSEEYLFEEARAFTSQYRFRHIETAYLPSSLIPEEGEKVHIECYLYRSYTVEEEVRFVSDAGYDQGYYCQRNGNEVTLSLP